MAAEKTLNFIRDYKELRVLWDISFAGYSDKVKRSTAYTELGNKYDLTEKGVKLKIKSLRSYFAKEVTKLKIRRKQAEPGESYGSSWFAFDAMLFLEDAINPRCDRVVGYNPKPDHVVKWDDLGLSSGDNTDDETGPSMSNEENSVDIYTPEETEDNSPSFSLSKISGRKRKYEVRERDNFREENASNSLKNSYINELAIFSHLIRIQLSKLSRLNQVIAKNKINNFLFDLEMDELNHTVENSFKRHVFSEEPSLESLSSVENEMLLFAQMIQIQVSRLNRRNQMLARNEITNLVFELEMKELKKSSAPQISSYAAMSSSSPLIRYVPTVSSLHPQISPLATVTSTPPQISSVTAVTSPPQIISPVATVSSSHPQISSLTAVTSSPQISPVATVSSSPPQISPVATVPSSPPQSAMNAQEDPCSENL